MGHGVPRKPAIGSQSRASLVKTGATFTKPLTLVFRILMSLCREVAAALQMAAFQNSAYLFPT